MANLDLAYKRDAARALERMEAWWHGAILDRPCIQVRAPQPAEKQRPWPQKQHATHRERWMDVEYQVECADVGAANAYWGGEILPYYNVNIGPEVMTAALGAELEFSEGTSWSVPILKDWVDVPKLKIDPDNVYMRAVLGMTRRGLEVGRGKFLTGITDLHPGGDLAASLRDPQQFAIDLALEPERAMELMDHLRPTFYEFYDLQYDLMLAAGQTVTTSWLPLATEGRYYIPSNDFSCMVSPRMFSEFFLSEIIEECEWLDRSIYHLDGPGALQHLDTLLDIERLGAVQWVWGAGREPGSKWMDVFKTVLAAGKNVWIDCAPWEVEIYLNELAPERVMLCTWADSVEGADALIAKVSRWTAPGKW